MIERKRKVCKGCELLKFIFSKKMCKNCASKDYKGLKPKTKREGYTDFFNSFGDVGVCQETGQKINNLKNANICHIFPKRKYKSISRDKDNIIILTWQNHILLDTFLDAMDLESIKNLMPNSYEYIIAKAESLLPIIEERGKLYFILKDTIDGEQR